MRRCLPLILAGAVTFGACSGGGGGGSGDGTAAGGAGGGDTTSSTRPGLSAQVASYDLAVGPPSRVIVGVFNPEEGPVGYGTVNLSFAYLGEKPPTQRGSVQAEQGPSATGTYLPLPGSAPAPAGAEGPTFLTSSERGVYAAQVAFDKAGYWGVIVSADLDSGTRNTSAVFPVLAEHEVPVPGDVAPRTENLTVSSTEAPPEAIDSRARDGKPVPDPGLHATTVASALAAGRPVMLVISTPTFCVSKFCGPITQTVGELAGKYGDRATFIHIEVWKDFEAKVINDAANEWIASADGDAHEPWVFLIGADGKVTARFDNVASLGEMEAELGRLPVLGS